MADVEKVLNAFGKKVVRNARAALAAKGKDASGTLSKSLGYHLKVYPSGAVDMSFVAAGYARIVDEGVSGTKKKYNTPFAYTTKQPPSSVIDKWVVRKGLKAARNKKGQFVKRKSLVFAIARSIKLYGIEPTRFFTDAFNKAYKTLPKEIVRAYANDANKFFKFVTKDM